MPSARHQFLMLFRQIAPNFIGSSMEFYTEITFLNVQKTLLYIETQLLPVFDQCLSYSFTIERASANNEEASGDAFISSLLKMALVQRCANLKITLLLQFKFTQLPVDEISNWLLHKHNASDESGLDKKKWATNKERVLDIFVYERSIAQQLAEHLTKVKLEKFAILLKLELVGSGYSAGIIPIF